MVVLTNVDFAGDKLSPGWNTEPLLFPYRFQHGREKNYIKKCIKGRVTRHSPQEIIERITRTLNLLDVVWGLPKSVKIGNYWITSLFYGKTSCRNLFVNRLTRGTHRINTENKPSSTILAGEKIVRVFSSSPSRRIYINITATTTGIRLKIVSLTWKALFEFSSVFFFPLRTPKSKKI